MSRSLLELVRRFGFPALLLVFVVLLGGGLTYYLLRLEKAELTAQARVGALYTRNFEEQVTQSLNLVDWTLRSSGEAAAGDPGRLAQRLRDALRGAPLLRSLSLLGDDGRIEVSTNAANVGVFVSDAGFLPPAHAGAPQLRIGARWAGRDFGDAAAAGDVYLIPVLRAIDFGGRRRVLVAALNPDYFINQFSVRLQGESTVAVVARFDGVPLLSTQAGDPVLAELRALPLWGALGETASGGFEWTSAGGRAWLVSFRASRDHPLVIVTRVDRDFAIAGWREEARQLLLIVLPALFGLLALTVALYLAQRREALRRAQEAGEIAERQRLAVLFDALPANLLLLDDRGRVRLCNGEWSRFLGRIGADVEDDGVGRNVLALAAEVFASGADATLAAGVAAILDASSELFAHEVEVRADGGSLWLQMLLRPLRAEHLHGAVLLLFDISARKAAEEELRLASVALESAAEGVAITDSEGHLLRVNRAFSQITGYRLDELVGESPWLLASGRQDPALVREVLGSLAERGLWQGEIANRRKNGEVFTEWLSISAVTDRQGQVGNYLAIFSDISERKASEERIRFLSEHDFLTGLPNRALLEDRLAQMISYAERFGGQLALLFVDLDRFKAINDTLGHHIGDLLLKQVARRIGEGVRVSDTVSRQGGDEFLVLLREIDAPEDAARVAEKLIESIGAPYRIEGHTVRTAPSIGIALYPDDGRSMGELVRNADTAMYHSKERGRNTYSFFSEAMNAAALERLALERGLRLALERRELSLHFQPLLELASGRVVCAEALLRWHSAELGMVAPDRFIPVAEATGLICPIGEWVIAEACRHGAAWRSDGGARLKLAINVSGVQLGQSDFVERVRAILAETGFPAGDLEFEVNEDVLLVSAEARLGVVAALRSLGISFAIDDFGSGCSSLATLRRLSIDKLKIGRGFIGEIGDVDASGEAGRGASFAEAIVRMAQQMGLQIVAEGVENGEQLAFLRARECDAIQGFLISPALAADEFAAFVAAPRSAGAELPA